MRPLKLKLLPVGRRPMLTLADEFCCVEVTVPTSVPSSSWPFRYTCSCGRRRVVDPGHVVPGVGLQRGRPVPEHLAARAVRQLEPDRARPPIDRRVELIADLAARTLGDDRRVINRERRRVDPRAHRHAPRQLQRVGLPSSTKSFTPSSCTAPALRPVPHVAPFVNVPVSPFPDASAAVVPDPSLNA